MVGPKGTSKWSGGSPQPAAAGADREALRRRRRAVGDQRHLAQPGARSPPRRAGSATRTTSRRSPASRGSTGRRFRCWASERMPIGPTPLVKKPSTSPIVEAGVGERAARALGVDLVRGLVGREARRMLVHARRPRPCPTGSSRSAPAKSATQRVERAPPARAAPGARPAAITSSRAPAMPRAELLGCADRRDAVVGAGDDQRRHRRSLARSGRPSKALQASRSVEADARIGLHLLHPGLAHHVHAGGRRERLGGELLRQPPAHDVASRGDHLVGRQVEAGRRAREHEPAQAPDAAPPPPARRRRPCCGRPGRRAVARAPRGHAITTSALASIVGRPSTPLDRPWPGRSSATTLCSPPSPTICRRHIPAVLPAACSRTKSAPSIEGRRDVGQRGRPGVQVVHGGRRRWGRTSRARGTGSTIAASRLSIAERPRADHLLQELRRRTRAAGERARVPSRSGRSGAAIPRPTRSCR